MIRVLQILPRVPPAVCGIGDYAWGIARKLRVEHGIHSSFLAAGTTWTQPVGETEFPVFRLPELSARALVEFVEARKDEFQAVVLHMSPYGYQKRAVPFWLASGWRQLSQKPGCPRLITMFHELYASGSMRSSAFWLQPLQKWALRTVARASDGLRTNRQGYADWLQGISGLKTAQVEVMPVFSNFGELNQLVPLKNRPDGMIMFASGIHGGADVSSSLKTAALLARRFELSVLHVIGGVRPQAELIEGVRLKFQAHLPGAEASELLAGCRMAYSAYNPEFLAKSTFFASFAAHGLPVITLGKQPVLPDGLRDGVNVLHASSCGANGALAPEILQEIAGNLHVWYCKHSLTENASSYARDITGRRARLK